MYDRHGVAANGGRVGNSYEYEHKMAALESMLGQVS
jgi:hypothetical protein